MSPCLLWCCWSWISTQVPQRNRPKVRGDKILLILIQVLGYQLCKEVLELMREYILSVTEEMVECQSFFMFKKISKKKPRYFLSACFEKINYVLRVSSQEKISLQIYRQWEYMDTHLIIDKLALSFTKISRCLSNLKFKKEVSVSVTPLSRTRCQLRNTP